jgi:hypothetical protein
MKDVAPERNKLFKRSFAESSFSIRDFVDVEAIPLPLNCQQLNGAVQSSGVEPQPKRFRDALRVGDDDTLFFWETPITTPVLSSLLLEGINAPSSSKQNELWSDLFDVLSSVSHSARIRDLGAIDAVLEAWFPVNSGDIRMNASNVEGGKAIFISEFCTLLDPVAASVTTIKLMELWDSVIQVSSVYYL